MICWTCTHDLPDDAFQPINQRADGTIRRERHCRDCKQERRAAWDAAKQARPLPVDREKVPRLPVEPFAEWVRAIADDGDSAARIAARLGLSEKTITRLLAGRGRHISLDIVDRAFCHAGDTLALRELYPHLYESERTAA